MGTDAEMEAVTGENTERVDLQGKTVTPGFVEGHQHMIHFGFNLLYVDCNGESIADIVTAVEQKAKELKEDEWIFGIVLMSLNSKRAA